MSRIGFVILTHSKPHQIKRLVTRLNTMFDAPPIVIHHDFGKCPLPGGFLPPNVSFVLPHLETGWGKFSIVEATVRGFAQMYRQPDSPDWCVLLSGACYPIKTAARIWHDLTTNGYDAYIQFSRIDREAMRTLSPHPPDPLDNLSLDWHRERYQRYCVKRVSYLSADKHLRPRMRFVRLPDVLGKRLLPFSENFPCYAGGQWFTVNRRAAEYLISFQRTPANRALVNHYRDVSGNTGNLAPEESYFQTVFCNAASLKVSYYNLRYLDWTEHWAKRTGHPKLLTLDDLDALEASPTHFARKIDLDTDADLLDALDCIIDARTESYKKVSA